MSSTKLSRICTERWQRETRASGMLRFRDARARARVQSYRHVLVRSCESVRTRRIHVEAWNVTSRTYSRLPILIPSYSPRGRYNTRLYVCNIYIWARTINIWLLGPLLRIRYPLNDALSMTTGVRDGGCNVCAPLSYYQPRFDAPRKWTLPSPVTDPLYVNDILLPPLRIRLGLLRD